MRLLLSFLYPDLLPSSQPPPASESDNDHKTFEFRGFFQSTETMGIIAVAGGAGPVGKAIVDGLIAHGGHTVYVLSRSVG